MPLLWLECNIKAGACVFLKKSFPPLPAAKCCFSADFISATIPASSLSTNAFWMCSQEGVNFALSEEELPWWFRNNSVPFGSSGHSVEGASGTQGWVKSITHLVVTLDPSGITAQTLSPSQDSFTWVVFLPLPSAVTCSESHCTSGTSSSQRPNHCFAKSHTNVVL